MPGHKSHTNTGLAAVAVLMCLCCGVSFTQSSATPSPIEDSQAPDMFVAGNTDDSSIHSDGSASEDTSNTITTAPGENDGQDSTDTASDTQSSTASTVVSPELHRVHGLL